MIITCTIKRVKTEYCQIEILVPDVPAGKNYLQDLEEVYEYASELALARAQELELTAENDWQLDDEELTVEDTI
jgi:hypothetical protein